MKAASKEGRKKEKRKEGRNVRRKNNPKASFDASLFFPSGHSFLGKTAWFACLRTVCPGSSVSSHSGCDFMHKVAKTPEKHDAFECSHTHTHMYLNVQ